MAIVITVDDVKAVAPDTGATDANIQLQIDIATCKLDACLEAAYADCLPIAQAIKTYVVAHFCGEMGTSDKLESRRWADGSAESFHSDLNSTNTPYWDSAQAIDSAGCLEQAYDDRRTFVVTGKSYTYSRRAK
ncbi:hypothetical protein [Vibrio phage LP.1]|nr:hypothetical protein [Vibrio phage LP.1]